jgi:hypothetical protein
MMKYLFFVPILLLYGCATKYILAGNRFITPETQGGALNGTIEVQKTGATQLTVNINQSNNVEGAVIITTARTGFLYNTSFFEQFDFVWSHTGSGNSMLGGKFQFIGPSRTANGAGHKFALAGLFGGNNYETDDKAVKFTLGGTEYLAIYGYRLNESVLFYSSFSYADYLFKGKITSSNPTLNGQRPNLNTRIRALYAGIELTYQAVFLKVESGYQELVTTDTKDFTHTITGVSFGYAW